MGRVKTLVALLLAGVMLLAGGSAAFGKTKVNIGMIIWRGMTKAEEGFQAGLMESADYDPTFTVMDANRSKEKLAEIVDTLDVDKYDLIYTFGTTVVKTVKKKVTEKPIVFCIVSRPVKAGVIASWENSGNNVVGASNKVPMDSAFRTVSKVLKINRLGFVYNPKEANSIIQRDEVAKFQETLGYTMVDGAIDNIDQIDALVEKLVAEKVDAVMLPSDSFVKASANELVPPINDKKIPTIVSIPAMVKDNGAFLGLGPDYFELGKLASSKAIAILGGKKPSELPSETLERQHLTVNLNTAKSIGITVPIQILRISTIVR